jgi:Stress responsive A/B Barrel Domain
MKRNTRTFAVLLAALPAALGGGCAIANQTPRTGQLRHVVLFKFKDGTAPEQVSVIEAKFSALPGAIPSIVDFEWGKDVSVEDKADGFTHCFVVTFADAAGRAAYLPHAAHQEFVELLLPSLDKVLVIDYVASR